MSLKHWIEKASLEEYPGSGGDISQELDTPELTGGNFEQPEHIDHLASQQALDGETEQAAHDLVALEAYAGILQSARGRGGVDAATARLLAVGLESMGLVETDEKIQASIEDFASGTRRTKATNVSIESIGEALKSGWEKFKELLAKAWQMAKEFYGSIVHDAEHLRPKVEALSKRIANLGSFTHRQGKVTIQIKDANRLMVRGKFVGDNPTLLIKPATYVIRDYPDKVGTYVLQLHQVLNKVYSDPSKTPDEQELLRLIAAIPSPTAQLQSTHGEVLPGNKVLMAGESDDTPAKDDVESLKVLISKQAIYLKELTPDAAPTPYSYSLEFDKTILHRRLTAIQTTLDMIAQIHKNPQRMDNAIDRLNEWVDTFQNSVKAQRESEGSNRAADSNLITGLRAVAKMFGPDVSEVVKYCYTTLVAYIGVLAQEVAAFEAHSGDA